MVLREKLEIAVINYTFAERKSEIIVLASMTLFSLEIGLANTRIIFAAPFHTAFVAPASRKVRLKAVILMDILTNTIIGIDTRV